MIVYNGQSSVYARQPQSDCQPELPPFGGRLYIRVFPYLPLTRIAVVLETIPAECRAATFFLTVTVSALLNRFLNLAQSFKFPNFKCVITLQLSLHGHSLLPGT